jgi:hypothetical protein
MSAPPVFLRASAIPALALLAATAACSSPFALPPANLATAAGTVTLWALTGTDLSHPSAYDVMLQTVVRTDRTSAFDFAFDIRVDSLQDTSAVLLPRGVLGLSVDGGLQVTTQAYDSITIAPTPGYQDTLPVVVKAGTVLLAASRAETCNFGYVRPIYAKLRITAVDPVARTLTFDVLTDPNCGYRSLKADSLPPTE